MIIRKPYAFLIKHFKKIHILLLLISAFVYYKTVQLSSFVNEFFDLGTYDIYNEPITQFVNFFSMFAILFLIAGSAALILLLYYKKKPWKLYLLPIIEYVLVFIVFISAKGFFDSYKGGVDVAAIRALRDYIFIMVILQYPVMLFFLLRILGVDLKKFNFKMDEEYLSMEQEDREELEININFDKDSIHRGIRKVIRNIGYLYAEHRFISNTIIAIVSVIAIYNSYKYIFVTNKVYKQGETLRTNNYEITINDSYYSDKDYAGNEINKKSGFVVVEVTIKNNGERRKVDLDRFHLMSGIDDYTTTDKTYETEFQDYGKTYEKLELRKDESVSFIMIFKVKKQIIKHFVLYYQELDWNSRHLRKIKIKTENVSKIKKHKAIDIGEKLNFVLKGKEEYVIFEDYKLSNQTEFTYRICYSSECSTKVADYQAKKGQKILKIPFASNNFEGKDMIDFSSKYGRINYIDNKGERNEVTIKNPFDKTYYGKYLYVSVPEEIEKAKSIELNYIIRNNQYTYILK